MEKIDYSKYSMEQLERFAAYGETDEIANEAWAKYKENGGSEWQYFAAYGKTDVIANEAWAKYKENGGSEWQYFAAYGKTDKIKNEAKLKIYDICEALIQLYNGSGGQCDWIPRTEILNNLQNPNLDYGTLHDAILRDPRF